MTPMACGHTQRTFGQTVKFAKQILDEIINDLTDRSGCSWDQIDEHTQKEIRKDWACIVAHRLLEAER